MPCPECRNEFQIPKNGVAGLLIRTHGKEPKPAEVCEACSTEELIIPATVYCVDCSQKLCRRCSVPHMKMKSGPHEIRSLDAISSEYRGGDQYCDKHRERVRMYCFDCRANVCSTCCIEEHKTHNYDKIDTVSEEFSRSIADAIEPITSRIENIREATAKVEAQATKMLKNIEKTEQKLRFTGVFVQQIFNCLIDGQMTDLLQELQLMKLATEKEVKSQTDTLKLALSEMESFRRSSLELRSKGSPSDITQAANDVHARAKVLLETYVIPSEYHAPSYTFNSVNIDELLLRDRHNVIGHLVKSELGEASGNIISY